MAVDRPERNPEVWDMTAAYRYPFHSRLLATLRTLLVLVAAIGGLSGQLRAQDRELGQPCAGSGSFWNNYTGHVASIEADHTTRSNTPTTNCTTHQLSSVGGSFPMHHVRVEEPADAEGNPSCGNRPGRGSRPGRNFAYTHGPGRQHSPGLAENPPRDPSPRKPKLQ